MTKKLYDVCAVTGEYQTNDGMTKRRFQRVGSMMENDNGQFLILERWFNPAGAAEPGKDCFLSLFEPRSQGQAPQAGQPAAGNAISEPDIPF